MGQAASRAPGDVRVQATQAKEAMALYALCWHGCPSQKGMEAQATPPVPLYDSDDETTDSAVISALAMTDPAELGQSYRQTLNRAHSHRHRSVHAPILQSLTDAQPHKQPAAASTSTQQPSPTAVQPAQATTAAAAQGGVAQPSTKHHRSNSASSNSSSSQHRRHRCKDTTMTPAASAAAAAAAAARQPVAARHRFAATGPPKAPAQQPGKYQGRVVVPLSEAALDAVGAPCRIGADLPPASLQSQRGSGADVVALRPYHHLHMMQLHKKQQQHEQQQQKALCSQMQQVHCVWGWQVGSGNVTQVVT